MSEITQLIEKRIEEKPCRKNTYLQERLTHAYKVWMYKLRKIK